MPFASLSTEEIFLLQLRAKMNIYYSTTRIILCLLRLFSLFIWDNKTNEKWQKEAHYGMIKL